MNFFHQLPPSVLQAGAIFLSIIIEALPFVLIGSIISGFIEVYITPDKVYRYLPKNKWCRIFFGTFIGFIFPRLIESFFKLTASCSAIPPHALAF